MAVTLEMKMCCLLLLVCLVYTAGAGNIGGGGNKWSGEETRFVLHTRQSKQVQYLSIDDPNSILNSNFDSDIPTKFIIHGFDENGNEDWIKRLYRALLTEGNYNVIIIDWKGGAEGGVFDYDDVVDYNAPKVSTKISLLIEKLKSTVGISLNDVHLIGFSLGAHVAGYVGKKLNGEIGRITGLDPAGPEFEDAARSKRLDRTDAVFVDVIHTEVVFLGIEKKIGNVDLYLHGGEDQPGCDIATGFLDFVTNVLIPPKGAKAILDSYKCDHKKATEYFTDSLDGSCGHCSCRHYKSYIDGYRRSSCPPLGLQAYEWYKRNIKSQRKRRSTDKSEVLLPDIGTRFFLHTLQTTSGELLNTDSISNVDGAKSIKIIIHGMEGTVSDKWVTEMSHALLTANDYNVINVDWEQGSKVGALNYKKAISNARTVGSEIALLLKEIQDTVGISFNDVHLIGFGIGAHVAGYAGKILYGKIGRITGLDPIGQFFKDTGPKESLDPSDAIFVDVIHTEVSVFGIDERMGHVDFYPNGGNGQPGCPSIEVPTVFDEDAIHDIVAAYRCQHMMAVEYFTASIDDRRKFFAFKCKDYQTYVNGGCLACAADGCPQMGLPANDYAGHRSLESEPYFLQTIPEKPYEATKVTVEIIMAKTPKRKFHPRGRIYATCVGSDQFKHNMTRLSQTQHFNPGETYVYNTVIAGNMEEIREVKLLYEYDRHWYDIRFLKKPVIYIQSVTISDHVKHSVKFCDPVGIYPGTTQTITSC